MPTSMCIPRRTKRMKVKEFILANLLVVAIICCITGTIGGFGWEYTLNHWLIFAHKEPSMTFFKGFLIGLFPPLGVLSIMASFLTFVLSLFIG